ncbi:MAG: XRE family transcriptional regulator [Pseudomonadota bacterium]
MALKIRAKINRELLAWARKSAGLSVSEAARKIGGKSLKPERLEGWETGAAQPTVAQLRKTAQVYKRPLATFFLAEFPRDFTIPHDFRRLPGDGLRAISPELRLEIRQAEERRELALDLYDDLGEQPLEFSLSASLDEEPEEIGDRIRTALNLSVEEQLGWLDPQRYKPLNQWRRRIEELGVLVFQFSDVEPSESLGFSIAEAYAPVIAVNRTVRPNGRIFTMMHEFAHLMLRQGGLCDIEENLTRPPEEQHFEVFCNRVSAAALVPADHFVAALQAYGGAQGPRDWTDEVVEELANRYSVSREVIVRRMLTLRRTTQVFYERKRADYRAQLAEAQSKKAQESGGFESPATRVVSKEGPAFVRLVLENYYQGHITLSDVCSYLGVRVKHLPRIEQSVLAA